MKQTILVALLAFSIASCNNQNKNADTPAPTGNSDSVGATGANPSTGTIDTTMAPQTGAPIDSGTLNRKDSAK